MSLSQAKILEYSLNNCLFDGWSTKLLSDACKNANLDENYWKIIFPAGPIDLVDYFNTTCDENTAKNLKTEGLRTNEKIKEAVKLRISQNKKYKEQLRSTIGVYTLHPVRATQSLYRTVDSIWRLCGDKATDWNFYTKRVLLAGVYSSTLMFWLNDKSANEIESWNFLDRRLAEVGLIGKNIATIKNEIKKISEKALKFA